MTNEQKRAIMNTTSCELNKAKDLIYRASEKLTNGNLDKDAIQLIKMLYRLEAFQNKYN